MWNARIAAYCLMTSHYHLLIQTPDANLSRCMRHINGIYTQRFNRAYDCDGPLFRGRYKSILVDGDSYLLELVRSIHRNPLEAGLVDRLDSYGWSSHKGYLSDAKKWSWLHKDFVLKMFSECAAEGKRRYRAFVRMEIPEEINQILGRRKWPSVMGSEHFVDRVKKKFFSKKRHEEVPESKLLAPDVATVKNSVCRLYGVSEEGLLVSKSGMRNEARNVAIYLQRQLRGSKLEEIGEEYDIRSYSTVRTIIERTKNQMVKNRRLRKHIEQLRHELEMSQKQTPCIHHKTWKLGDIEPIGE